MELAGTLRVASSGQPATHLVAFPNDCVGGYSQNRQIESGDRIYIVGSYSQIESGDLSYGC